MLTIMLLGASFLLALVAVLLALRVQYRWIVKERIEREAWEAAQEARQLHWEKKQRKRSADIEQALISTVEQVYDEWRAWETSDGERISRLRQEYELLHLPTIEETPLALRGYQGSYSEMENWQPTTFYKADLRGFDFSHRYLGHANMQGALLSDANFYMADLCNACLAGADLTNANLTGANLSSADLRGATLTGATFLVADMREALLTGANLHGARSLTTAQIYTAFYDHTTRLDPDIDVTMPRISTALPLTPVPETQHIPKTTQSTFDQPLLLLQASSDSPRDPLAAGLPGDTPEISNIAGSDTAVPTTIQNVTQQAKAS